MWQPIETCPNTDAPVLVYGRIWSQISDAEKDNLERWDTADVYVSRNVVNGVCYVEAGFATNDMAECRATHWIPIPEPPNA